MGSLIARWTAIAAVAVTMIVASTDASAGTKWPLLVLRAGLASGIIVLAGRVVGFVLMRTALRRHYEQWRMAQAGSRPRSER
jgi:IS5 family transposase